ncbi:MAG: hypothetical protein C4560_12285 [Nitrospiraceae bacterium]|nr:MAG: hypothetical protein C4560_12285 [Nitrospiraceae bacterium]
MKKRDRRTYDYYATIRQVSSGLASRFDHNSIFNFIGGVTYEAMGLDRIYLLAAAPGRGYEVVYKRGKRHKDKKTGAKRNDNKESLKIDNRSGIVKFYGKSDDIIIKNELKKGHGAEEIESIKKDLALFEGEVTVPVFVDHKLKLLMVLGGKSSGNMFTREDMDLLRTISLQTAIAVKNAGFYRERVNSERLASIGMMSATFAHEIRNPLTSLKTFAQLMPEKYNDREFRDTFSKIVVGEIEKIDGLISDLLDFSSKKKSTRMNNFDLMELVDEIVDYVKGKLDFEKSGIVIEKKYNGDEINMAGDAGKLKQAFTNIMINGCQAMYGEGTLKVHIKLKDGHADISVEDTGEGIHSEDLSKIFDPFVTTKEMGVGLGLAISKRIIEDHNGKIHVRSRLSKGTVFTVSLPVQNG